MTLGSYSPRTLSGTVSETYTGGPKCGAVDITRLKSLAELSVRALFHEIVGGELPRFLMNDEFEAFLQQAPEH